MKMRELILEIICGILILNFAYEGIYKLFYFHDYAAWAISYPYLRPIRNIFAATVIAAELAIIPLLYSRSYRKTGLIAALVMIMGFVAWIVISFFTEHIYVWPYHPLWPAMNWMGRLETSLLIAWLCFIALLIQVKILGRIPGRSTRAISLHKPS